MHRAFIIFFFFNDTATTEIYTLSLHDALPTSSRRSSKLSLNHPGMSMACGLADCAKAANGASSAAVSVSRPFLISEAPAEYPMPVMTKRRNFLLGGSSAALATLIRAADPGQV